MASQASWAKGTKLYKGGPHGTPIAELTNINGLGLDSDEIDTTPIEPEDGCERNIQGIKRTGVVSLEGNFIPSDTGQQDLMADYLSGEENAYSIVFPSQLNVAWNFNAFVKKAPSTSAPVEGKVPFAAELRVNGMPSLVDLSESGAGTWLSNALYLSDDFYWGDDV